MFEIKKYNFFIFDCDGVILDSNSIKNEAFKLTLKNENSNMVNKFIKYHKENGGISRYEKFSYFYENMKKSSNSTKEVTNALVRFSNIVKKELINAIYVPGVINFLEEINKNKKKIYIVSGSDQEELISVFQDRKITHFFEKIFGSPTDKKTNTLLVLKNHFKTSRGIFFGDSKLDFECARYYKMDFVFVKKYSEWEDFDKYKNEFLFTINDFSKLQYIRQC